MVHRVSMRFSLRLLFLSVAAVAFLLFLWQRKQTASCAVTLAPASAGGSELGVLQSKFVISRAIDRIDFPQLDVLNRSDAVEWIQSHLSVVLPKDAKSETAQLMITARNADPEELKIIVEAVAEAYEREVAQREELLRVER